MEQNKKKARARQRCFQVFKTMPAAYADRSFFSAMITVCQAFIPQVIRISVDGVLGSDLSKIPEWVKAFLSEETIRENPGKMLTIAALAVILLAAITLRKLLLKGICSKRFRKLCKGHERSVV